MLDLLDQTLLDSTLAKGGSGDLLTLNLEDWSCLRLGGYLLLLNLMGYCLRCFLILFRVHMLRGGGGFREGRLREPLGTLGITAGLIISQVGSLWLLNLRSINWLLKWYLLMQILVRYFSILRVNSLSRVLFRGH